MGTRSSLSISLSISLTWISLWSFSTGVDPLAFAGVEAAGVAAVFASGSRGGVTNFG